MAVNPTDLVNTFDNTVLNNGQLIRLRTFAQTYSGAQYDESYSTQSGADIWFMGMQQPIDKKSGGEDFEKLEQGMIRMNDSKLFIPGSISFDTNNKFKLFVGGSPSLNNPYEIIDNGVIDWGVSGVSVYKKLYIRLLNGGSFSNEY